MSFQSVVYNDPSSNRLDSGQRGDPNEGDNHLRLGPSPMVEHTQNDGYNNGDYDYNREKAKVAMAIEEMVLLFDQILGMSEIFGTSQDTNEFRQNIQKKVAHANGIAQGLQSNIDQFKLLNTGTAEERHEKQLHIEKLESTLFRFLSKFRGRAAWIQEQLRSEPYDSNSLYRHHGDIEPTATEEEHIRLLDTRMNAEYMQMSDAVSFQSTQISEREEAIKKLQREMSEVHDVFRDLANLVTEQGSMVFDIESYIENAKQNVTVAHNEVKQAHRLQSKGRTKMCCIALMVTLIAALVVIIIIFITHKPLI